MPLLSSRTPAPDPENSMPITARTGVRPPTPLSIGARIPEPSESDPSAAAWLWLAAENRVLMAENARLHTYNSEILSSISWG
jgi:hypothetical protein